jgi:hypothetical protein
VAKRHAAQASAETEDSKATRAGLSEGLVERVMSHLLVV